MIKVSSLKADSHLRACKDFIVGHTGILKAYDLSNITSNTTDWAFSPSTTLVLIKHESALIGGLRLQIADDELALPIEDAVGDLDASIYPLIKQHKEEGTAELCGLWNTITASKLGIGSIFLGQLGLAVASQLNIKSLFALAAPTTVKNCSRVGFKIEQTIGDKGTFYYPKLDLIATAMKVENILSLDDAEEEQREYIFDLRKQPSQRRVEISRNKELEIEFDLVIKQ